MTELKGQALQDRASELQIKGRSSMKAGELRLAIAREEEALTVRGSGEVLTSEHAIEIEKDAKNIVEKVTTFAKSWIPVQNLSSMSNERREEIYRSHNNGGAPRPGKQARRLKHKANSLTARGSAA